MLKITWPSTSDKPYWFMSKPVCRLVIEYYGFIVLPKPRYGLEWFAAQQDVYLKIIDIVQSHGADFAFPSQTLYMDNITPQEQGR